MMMGGTRAITASNSALGLDDMPATTNARSVSEVALAAIYTRTWGGDMQGPPFVRSWEAQEVNQSSPPQRGSRPRLDVRPTDTGTWDRRSTAFQFARA